MCFEDWVGAFRRGVAGGTTARTHEANGSFAARDVSFQPMARSHHRLNPSRVMFITACLALGFAVTLAFAIVPVASRRGDCGKVMYADPQVGWRWTSFRDCWQATLRIANPWVGPTTDRSNLAAMAVFDGPSWTNPPVSPIDGIFDSTVRRGSPAQDPLTSRRCVSLGHCASGWPLLALEGRWLTFSDSTWMAQGAVMRESRSTSVTSSQQRPRLIPLIPRWPGLIGNTLIFASPLIALFTLFTLVRRRLRTRRGLCPVCAYPSSASLTTCPECGSQR